MHVLSLFTGIGGWEVGFGLAGLRADSIIAAEVDRYACAVYDARHGHRNIGDVSAADFETLFSDVRTPDILLLGSPPCQDLSHGATWSVHGQRGLLGPRSGLFEHFSRAVKELGRPRFAMENVASMRPADRDSITAELGCAPAVMLDAAHVSAQRRRRLFWTHGWEVEELTGAGPSLCEVLNDDGPRLTATASAMMQRFKGKKERWYAGFSTFSTDLKSKCVTRCWHKGPPFGTLLDTRFGRRIERKFGIDEVERLCGFPDGYTDCGLSRTRRLMALGNSVHPLCVRHLLYPLAGL